MTPHRRHAFAVATCLCLCLGVASAQTLEGSGATGDGSGDAVEGSGAATEGSGAAGPAEGSSEPLADGNAGAAEVSPEDDPFATVAASRGATYRATYEPAVALAQHVARRAALVAPPEPDPTVVLLGSATAVTPEIAAVFDVPQGSLAEPALVGELLAARRASLAEARERHGDAAAGVHVLATRANALARAPRVRTSRIDPAWAVWRAQDAMAREAVRRASREAWALERDVTRLEASVTWLERRQVALQAAAATLDDTVVASSAAEMQQEISQERQRLGAESERTSEIEADAARSREAAAAALARARTEREREIAEQTAEASEALADIAAERRRVEAVQETATTEKEAFLVQQSELQAQLAALIEAAEAGTPSRARADELYATVDTLRNQTRARAKQLRPEFEARESEIDALRVQLRQARAAVELVDQEETDASLRSSLRELREQQVQVAQRHLEVAEWRWEIERDAWVLARQQVYFFAQLSDRLVPYLTGATRRGLYRFTGENLALERDRVVDRLIGMQLITLDRIDRLDEFTSWLSSADGIAFVVRRLGLFIVVMLGVRWLYRRRNELVSGILKRLERVTIVRRYNAAVLKAAELVRDTAHWIALFFGASLLLGGVSSELPEVVLVQQLLQKVVMYLAGMAIVRTAIVPRAARGKLGNDARDIATFGIDLWQIPTRTATLVVLTLRVWLVYTIATSFAMDVTRFALGRSFSAYQIERLFLWGQIALVYALVWYWRDVIVEQTITLTGTAGSRAADLLTRHKDRVYSVLVLAFLALYVLVRVVWQFARGWSRDNAIARQISNFVFRKRVERAQAASTTGAAPAVALTALDTEYRTLFDPKSGCDAELYIRRNDEMTQLTTLFERWVDSDGAATAAIVGEWGMGKTTLLDAFERNIETDLPLARASMQARPKTPADVIAWLCTLLGVEGIDDEEALIQALNQGERRIVIVDDAHRLFVRTIGGFQTLDTMLRVMSLTNRVVFWIVTFDQLGWRYLNRVRNRRHSFHAVVELKPFSDDQVQNLIERRNLRAGVTPRFAQLLDEAEDDNIYAVIRTAAGFYRLLGEYAGGNPRLATWFWLGSVTPTPEGVDVRLFQRPSSADLARLSMAQRFALTALVQHDGLDVDRLREVIAVDVEEVELDLETLHDHDIVKRRSSGDYRVATRWYRAVLDDLRNRNLLVRS